MRVCSQKLDNIHGQTRRLETLTTSGTQAICTQLARVETLQQEDSRLQQMILARSEDQLQSLQKQLEVGLCRLDTISTESWRRNPRRRRKARGSVSVADVYWTTEVSSVPFGRWDICVSRGTGFQYSICATFVPPRWLSNTMLRWDLRTGCNEDSLLSGLQADLEVFYVNRNPLLTDTIKRDDLAGLLRLFDAKLARPSDHVVRWSSAEPESLIEVGIESDILQKLC